MHLKSQVSHTYFSAFFGIFVSLILSLCFSKVRTDKKGERWSQNPRIFVYAHKHEKYLKVCEHKNFKKSKFEKYSANWNPTFIFVDFDFTRVLWEFDLFECGNYFPHLSRTCDLLNGLDHDIYLLCNMCLRLFY